MTGARWSVYLAIVGENVAIGLGTPALLTLCLRLCEKRFGATQYALLSQPVRARALGDRASGRLHRRDTPATRSSSSFASSPRCRAWSVLLLVAPMARVEVTAPPFPARREAA